VPTAANSWSHTTEISANEALLVARLGTTEFFLEEGTGGTMLKRMAPSLNSQPPGVYPVLREDWAFQLNGERANEVLAQVCNVNFAALSTDSQPLVMTLMIGVAVLVVPQSAGRDAAERHYRIWCDPTFGPYLGESLGAVVIECGGRYTGDAL
jgi:sarcosine oxidase subunit gamma